MKQIADFIQEIRAAYNYLSDVLAKEDYAEKDAINGFKNIVQICIPYSSHLLKDKEWRNLWKKYNERANSILQSPKTVNNCYYFIDYALIFTDDLFCEEDMIQTYKLFDAFDNTIQALNNIIQSKDVLIDKFQNKLEVKIKAVITDGPSKADNSKNASFKNFVNEIAFFFYMADHPEIELTEIETALPNGKTVDFQLGREGEVLLVDTITVHNIAEQNDINRFVEGKISDKFSKKTTGLDENTILNHFKVLPIIEYDTHLLDYVPVLPKEKSLPPMMSLLQEENGKNCIALVQLPLDEKIKKQLIKREQ